MKNGLYRVASAQYWLYTYTHLTKIMLLLVKYRLIREEYALNATAGHCQLLDICYSDHQYCTYHNRQSIYYAVMTYMRSLFLITILAVLF